MVLDLETCRRTFAPATRPIGRAARWGLAALAEVGRVLSALDDRNPLTALRVLEPARAQEEGLRCSRCATRGE
ncbi:MAG TPA: hypothetical protein VKW08_25590 [Xanthobacteraceae bacterium]|nr:hypothetical protein [Xanthobacteraceae bacterium]